MSEARKNWTLIPSYISQTSVHSLFSRHVKHLKPADITEAGFVMSDNPGSHWSLAVCACRHIIMLDSKETSASVKDKQLLSKYEVCGFQEPLSFMQYKRQAAHQTNSYDCGSLIWSFCVLLCLERYSMSKYEVSGFQEPLSFMQ